MEFQQHYSRLLDEQCKTFTHSSGLKVTVCEKKGCVNGFAGFATNYGSMDNILASAAGDVTVPDGIAHFLEHKLFENEEVNADARFAKEGAAANAFTTFDKTCYYFTATQNFYNSLRILLEFVTAPYFTDESVQKEQGIIGQEIMMYNDSPGWMVLFNLLGALYHENPVKIDTAGTVESIAEITPQLLYDCYNAFYNLRNMALVVVGDVETERVAELCDACLKPAPEYAVRRAKFDEPREVVKDYVELKLAVGLPMFALGYKVAPVEAQEDAIRLAAAEIVLDLICGKSSDCYRRLYDSGLITASFEAEHFCGRGYAVALFSGESVDPQKTADTLREAIVTLQKDGISDADFARAKAKLCGTMLRRYNSAETEGLSAVEESFMGIEPFSYGEAAFKVQKSDADRFLRECFNEQARALSVVLPAQSAE